MTGLISSQDKEGETAINERILTCRKEPKVHPMAAFSKSASSKTTAEALPPNSRSTGLMYLPAVAAMMEPTLVLPVKLIFRTAGCAISVVVISAASDGLW